MRGSLSINLRKPIFQKSDGAATCYLFIVKPHRWKSFFGVNAPAQWGISARAVAAGYKISVYERIWDRIGKWIESGCSGQFSRLPDLRSEASRARRPSDGSM